MTKKYLTSYMEHPFHKVYVCLFKLLHSNWVVGIEEDSTLATNMLLSDTIIDTTSTTQRAGIGSTLNLCCSLQAHESVLTPEKSPAVTDKPVVSAFRVGTISHKLDG
jgi:hypothetical protein